MNALRFILNSARRSFASRGQISNIETSEKKKKIKNKYIIERNIYIDTNFFGEVRNSKRKKKKKKKERNKFVIPCRRKIGCLSVERVSRNTRLKFINGESIQGRA